MSTRLAVYREKGVYLWRNNCAKGLANGFKFQAAVERKIFVCE